MNRSEDSAARQVAWFEARSAQLIESHQQWLQGDPSNRALLSRSWMCRVLPNIQGGALKLYLWLVLNANPETGECPFVTVNAIARALGYSGRCINDWFNELDRLGLVERIQKKKSEIAHTFLVAFDAPTLAPEDVIVPSAPSESSLKPVIELVISDDIAVTRARVLRAARLRAEMTLAELSNLTGLTTSYHSNLETGKKVNPSMEALILTTRALKISLADLYPQKETANA